MPPPRIHLTRSLDYYILQTLASLTPWTLYSPGLSLGLLLRLLCGVALLHQMLLFLKADSQAFPPSHRGLSPEISFMPIASITVPLLMIHTCASPAPGNLLSKLLTSRCQANCLISMSQRHLTPACPRPTSLSNVVRLSEWHHSPPKRQASVLGATIKSC